ncbi:hypothetical protein AAMO2058_001261400 [Amorphochlora amoebiformis]
MVVGLRLSIQSVWAWVLVFSVGLIQANGLKYTAGSNEPPSCMQSSMAKGMNSSFGLLDITSETTLDVTLRREDKLLAIGLVFEPIQYVMELVRNWVLFLSDSTTILVHANSKTGYTTQDFKAIENISPGRIFVVCKRIPVLSYHGTILQAQLESLKFARKHAIESTHVVFLSSNSWLFRGGAEKYIFDHGASIKMGKGKDRRFGFVHYGIDRLIRRLPRKDQQYLKETFYPDLEIIEPIPMRPLPPRNNHKAEMGELKPDDYPVLTEVSHVNNQHVGPLSDNGTALLDHDTFSLAAAREEQMTPGDPKHGKYLRLPFHDDKLNEILAGWVRWASECYLNWEPFINVVMVKQDGKKSAFMSSSKHEGSFYPTDVIYQLIDKLEAFKTTSGDDGVHSLTRLVSFAEEFVFQTWTDHRRHEFNNLGYPIVRVSGQSSSHPIQYGLSPKDIDEWLPARQESIFGLKPISRDLSDPHGTRAYLNGLGEKFRQLKV